MTANNCHISLSSTHTLLSPPTCHRFSFPHMNCNIVRLTVNFNSRCRNSLSGIVMQLLGISSFVTAPYQISPPLVHLDLNNEVEGTQQLWDQSADVCLAAAGSLSWELGLLANFTNLRTLRLNKLSLKSSDANETRSRNIPAEWANVSY